jgi:hypothetical protein
MRKKLTIEEKQQKLSICIDNDLFEIFENYMKEIGNPNKTKYIEKLIKQDLINRKLIKDDFIGLKNNNN